MLSFDNSSIILSTLGTVKLILAGRKGSFTCWDYRSGSFPKNHGLRIDHILASPTAADLITRLWVEKEVRGEEKNLRPCTGFSSGAFMRKKK